MIDIDDFKGFNDRFGHQAGDEVLRSIGARCGKVVRRSDVLARYGGEEFCLVVPHATPETLAAAGERLRAHIEAHQVDLGRPAASTSPPASAARCLAERHVAEERSSSSRPPTRSCTRPRTAAGTAS